MDDDDRWSVTVSSQPPAEPLTRAQVKTHLRIDASDTDHDSTIDALIVAVRELSEAYLGRALVRQTQVLTLDDWPYGDEIITVPNPPLTSVSSVEYTDQNGATQTVAAANYNVDTASTPGRIQPAYGFCWPTTREQISAVRVTYICGYAPSGDSPTDYAANIPKAIKQAMLLAIGTLFENRESMVLANLQAIEIPAYKALLWAHRVVAV